MDNPEYKQEQHLWIQKAEGYWNIMQVDPRSIPSKTQAFKELSQHLIQVLLIFALFGAGALKIPFEEGGWMLGLVSSVSLLVGLYYYFFKIKPNIRQLMQSPVLQLKGDKLSYFPYYASLKAPPTVNLSDSTIKKTVTKQLVEGYSFRGVMVIEGTDSSHTLPFLFDSEEALNELEQILLGTHSSQYSIDTLNDKIELYSSLYDPKIEAVFQTSHKILRQNDAIVIAPHDFKDLSSLNRQTIFWSAIFMLSLVTLAILSFPIILDYVAYYFALTYSFLSILIAFIINTSSLILIFYLLKYFLKSRLEYIVKLNSKGIWKLLHLLPFINYEYIPSKDIALVLVQLPQDDWYAINIILQNGQQKMLDVRFKEKEQALKYQQQIEHMFINKS